MREKPIVAHGLCVACYTKNRRSGAHQVRKLARAVEQIEAHISAADEARRILIDGLPEAPKLLKEAARIAAAKGDHRPAQVWLEGVAYDQSNEAKRVLSAIPKREAGQLAAPTVNIGIALGGIRPEARQLTNGPIAIGRVLPEVEGE